MALAIPLCAILFAAEDKLLFDFRASPLDPPPLPAEVRRSVLSAVFPHYLRSETDCKLDQPPTDATLEAARSRGQIVPEVQLRAVGSFTGPGARQIAYLIKVGECVAPLRSYFGTYRLAIFENGRLIASGQSPGGDYLDAVIDVDADGMDEILISGCGLGQGVMECSATLVSMAGGAVRTIQDFPQVFSDACGFSPKLGISATVIRYAPGPPPRFTRQAYRAPCPGPEQKPKFRPAAGREL